MWYSLLILLLVDVTFGPSKREQITALSGSADTIALPESSARFGFRINTDGFSGD
ncbi:hypothetical protein OH492_16835 [Vibrio chagasii]|nr:hypothetical protein [Vibrio chagasii]